jgi:hypothetical protein
VRQPKLRLPVRRNIALLATIREPRAAGATAPNPGYFGNIVEIGSRGMILEADRELRAGAPLAITVVFPGQLRTKGQDPYARFECRVSKTHDEQKLHYDLTILDTDDRSRERLHGYLGRGSAREGA